MNAVSEAAGIVLLVIGIVIGFLVLIAGISALIAGIIMLLWNGLAVPIFDAPALTFLQTWGLWFLLSLVGGAFRRVITFRSKS